MQILHSIFQIVSTIPLRVDGDLEVFGPNCNFDLEILNSIQLRKIKTREGK